MDGATVGMIGGIAGGVLGVVGGAVGTYFSISRAKGDAARAFMIKISVVGWIVVSVFVAAVLLLPPPWKHLVWVPYGLFLPLGIGYVNKRLAGLESKDGTAPAALQQ